LYCEARDKNGNYRPSNINVAERLANDGGNLIMGGGSNGPSVNFSMPGFSVSTPGFSISLNMPGGSGYPATSVPSGNTYSAMPTGNSYPSTMPTGNTYPSNTMPTGNSYPNTMPTGNTYPSTMPTGNTYSAMPTGNTYPSTMPTGNAYPTGNTYSTNPYPGSFYIVSQLNNLVLDIEYSNTISGARVITYNKKYGTSAANQLWTWNGNSIRSCLNGLALDISFNNNTDIIMFGPTNQHNQQWTFDGIFFTNPQSGKVLDIHGGNSQPGTKIVAWGKNGGLNQQFRLEYSS